MPNSIFRFKYIDIAFSLFSLFVFCCALLPSGSIFGVPIKSIVLVLIFVFLILAILKLEVYLTLRFYRDFSIIISVLFFYCFLGLLGGYDDNSVITEFKFILSFILMLLFVQVFLRSLPEKFIFLSLLKSAVLGSFLFVGLKSLLFFSVLFGFISFDFVQSYIYQSINYTPVGLEIDSGGSRFSFVTLDFISVIIISFYFLFVNRLRGWITRSVFYVPYLAFLLVSLFSAYSRALFFIFPLLFLLVFIVRRKWLFVAISISIIFFIALYNYGFIEAIIEQRFLNQGHSDSWRYLMVSKLLEYWSSSPIFGHGIGSYIPWFIRDKENPFSYEVQVIAILMKLGIIWVVTCISIFVILIKASVRSRYSFFNLVCFTIWFLLSFTNQYLFNTTAGVIAVLLYSSHRFIPDNE
jgi:hypothetical protein